MKRIFCILLCLLAVCLIVPRAFGEQSLSVTYTVPDGRSEDALTDTDVMTRITLRKDAKVQLTLSGAGEGHTAYLEWFSIPQNAKLEQFDADGLLLQTTVFQTPDAYAQTVPLDARCVKLTLMPGAAECTVSTLFVAGGAPDAVYERMEPTTACDVLFLAPTPAAAMETFGPLLAKYGAAHGVPIGVVCMTVDHRYCAQELEHALYTMGFRNAPIYLGCNDLNYLEATEIRKRWAKSEPENKLLALIDALNPKVVVSVGEREDDLRAAETAAIAQNTIPNTSVQKFYLVSNDGATAIDCTEAYAAFDGHSACEFATAAYRQMASRGVYRFRLPEKPALTLAFQTVGDDAACNDLLEHIDRNALLHYEDAATPAPTDTAAPETEPPATADIQASVIPTVFETAIPAATAPQSTDTSKPQRGLFSCGGREVTPSPAPTAVPTDAPTALPATPEPTPTPSSAPTDTPTPEPTSTPSLYAHTNFDEHFLEPDSDEYVFFDNENGEWIYRSDILAVEITRHSATYPYGYGEKPVVYFVAHIYERGYDSFRPTFGSWRHNGGDVSSAGKMALNAKCVLWITGDNLINSDREMKGTLIRDGYLFQKTTRFDTMVLDTNTMEMRIVHANEIGAEELLESGVENCFSFGPVTIENGEITPQAASTRRIDNPRTMLGMIEPGHFVAIVADGRQPGYSMGLNGEECANLMLSLGCRTAYNLDGGISATMIFMGNKINRHGTERYNGLSSSIRQMPDGLSWGYSELCGTFTDLQEDNG